jgi:PAS domain S-box-containing protein
MNPSSSRRSDITPVEKSVHTPEPAGRKRWILLGLAIALALFFGGQAYFQSETRYIYEKQSREIESIASLQLGQIVKWLEERRADVTQSVQSPFFLDAFEAWTNSPRRAELEDDLREWLRVDRDAYHYADAALLDPEGKVLLFAGETAPWVGPATLATVEAAVSTNAPTISELFRDDRGRICIDVARTIRDDEGRSPALLVLRSDAEQYLFPLIRSWPVPTETAEILLVHREEEGVRVLNSLRHQPDAALSLYFPSSRNDLAAVRAALGEEAVIQASDYRGVTVLAAMRSIPDTEWALVAKVDVDEILAEARYRAGVTVFFVALGILAVALGIAFVWRQRQAELYRELYLAERDQGEIQRRFRAVLYSIGDAVITIGTEGRVRHMNVVAETLTGWRESEAQGRPVEEVFRIINEETGDAEANPVHQVLREDEPVALSDRTVLIARDGTRRPISHNAAPVLDPSGRSTGVVLVFRDQTSERAAARALRQREERYRLLFDANPHSMWVYDLETLAFLEVNDAAIAHYGYSREEFLTMTIADIRPPEDMPRLRQSVTQAAERGPAGGTDRAGVWRHRRKDGSIIEVEITSHAMDFDGRPAELVLASDVTEIRQTTDRLMESEARFRSIVENEPECVKIVSIGGRLLDMNPAGLRLVEADSLDSVRNTRILDLIHPEHRHEFLRTHQAAARGGIENLEFRIVGLKGAVRWVETRSAPLRDSHGDVVSVLSVTRDVTERKEGEQRLRENEALMRLAGRTARLGGWAVNLGSGRVLWSDEVCEIHEVPHGSTPTVAEAFGHYAPEWRELAIGDLTACARRAIPFDFEAELITAKSRRIWVRAIGHAERDAGGAIARIQGALQDITERKQSEREIRQLADRLSATLESVTDAFYMLDHDWRFTYLNGEAERLLKRRRSELVGRIVWEEFPDIVGTAVESEYRRAVKDDCPTVFDIFYPPLDRWFEIRAFPSEGGLAVYFRDVTEQHTAQEIRQRDEARLSSQRNALIALTSGAMLGADNLETALRKIAEADATTIGAARVGIWRFNDDQTAIRLVELFEFESGLHSQGAELTQADHPTYFEALLKEDVIAANDARRDPRTREFRDDYLRPLGIASMLDVPIRLGGRLEGVLCHEHIGEPREWTADEKTFAIAIANLVSLILEQAERRKVEATLQHRVEIEGFLARASNRFLRLASGEIDAAIDEVLQGIGGVTGAERAYIFQINESRQTLVNTQEWCAPGIEPQKDKLQAVPMDSVPWWMSKLKSFRTIYVPHPDELPPEAANEREIFEQQGIQSLLSVPIFWRDKLGGFLGFETVRSRRTWSEEDRQALETLANTVALVLERTQAEAMREQLESQLLQSQKLEAVGRLAGGVAHDFNNMLTVILGHADMALACVQPSDEIHADLEEIIAAGRRSADLTRQLLTFARQQAVAPRVLDLNAIVGGALKMLTRLIGENVELVWKPGAGVWPVRMDPAQLDQILANLAVNARDAIRGVGRIVIETTAAELDDAYCASQTDLQPGEYSLLTFSDNGCGMNREILSRIFEPFFTTKEPGEGTGLGLATVYGILKQNGGHISAYSEPGQGTTFRVYLPRCESPGTEGSTHHPEAAQAGGDETVLLVEDEVILLGLVARQLEQLGYTVMTARSPREALELAGKYAGEIDLLITDVIMPEMNGRELALRFSDSRPQMKTLFMSGYTADSIDRHGILEEGICFLQKPFTKAALAARVREALQGQTIVQTNEPPPR